MSTLISSDLMIGGRVGGRGDTGVFGLRIDRARARVCACDAERIKKRACEQLFRGVCVRVNYQFHPKADADAAANTPSSPLGTELMTERLHLDSCEQSVGVLGALFVCKHSHSGEVATTPSPP